MSSIDPTARAALMEGIALGAADPDRTAFRDRVRSIIGGQPAVSGAIVALVEDLVTADQDFADVGPSIASLLRSQIAARSVQDAFAGLGPDDPDHEEVLTPDDVLRIARVRGQAQASVLAEPMLDANGLAAALGSTSTNPREYARAMRSRPGLLALRRGHRFVFPAFQVDAERGRIWPIVHEVNTELDAATDPWAAASFWFTVDSFLGARPADRVADPSAAVGIRAALDRELAPIG